MSNVSDDEWKFFQKNDAQINALIKRQSEFIYEKRKKDSERIENIIKKLDANWWICDGTDLGCKFKENDPEYEIGIESWFENNGSYRIKITNWKNNVWDKYDGILRSHFSPILEETIDGCRHNLFVKELKNQSEEEIAAALKNVWNVMDSIVNTVCKK